MVSVVSTYGLGKIVTFKNAPDFSTQEEALNYAHGMDGLRDIRPEDVWSGAGMVLATITTQRRIVNANQPTYSVYALIDPRDQKVYYVGITTTPHKRLREHYRISSYNADRSAWISSLQADKLFPEMKVLEEGLVLNVAQWKEERWIHHYHSLGMPLTNKSGVTRQYTRNIEKRWMKARREME